MLKTVARVERLEPAGLFSSVIVISGLHYLASTHIILVHEILRRFYYVPIVIAAIRYGARGGLAISLLSSALYLPHIILAWSVVGQSSRSASTARLSSLTSSARSPASWPTV